MTDVTRRQALALGAAAAAVGKFGAPELPGAEIAPALPAAVAGVEQALAMPDRPYVKEMVYWLSGGDFPEMSNAAPIGDLARHIARRLEESLPSRMQEARAFYDLKNKLITGEPERDASIREALERITGEKKQYYVDKLQRIAALFPDNPEFNPEASAYFMRIAELTLASGSLNAETPAEKEAAQARLAEYHAEHAEELNRLRTEDELHRFKYNISLTRYDEWSLGMHKESAEESLDSARAFGLVTKAFDAETKKKHRELTVKITELARATQLHPKDVNAIVDAEPFFLYECGEERHEKSSNSEPWHFLDNHTLFSRLAEMMGGQANRLNHQSLFLKTPQNFDYIATRLEADLQRAFLTAFHKEFPEIPEADIPLPKVHPSVIEWAVKSKEALQSSTQPPAAEASAPVAPANPKPVAEPSVHIGYTLINMGRKGLQALLKRKKDALGMPSITVKPQLDEAPAGSLPAPLIAQEIPIPQPDLGLSHGEKILAKRSDAPKGETYRE